MLPIRSRETHSNLFHHNHSDPWSVENADQTGNDTYFIEIPPVRTCQELENHRDFPIFKQQFLMDILEFRRLVHDYVDQQAAQWCDETMDYLYQIVSSVLADSMLPLYLETHYQIHQLTQHLKNNSNAYNRNYIASMFYHCLYDFELSPASIHRHFARSFLSMQLFCEEAPGRLYEIKRELFSEFIESFLFKRMREGVIDISSDMKIHLFNGLHNLYCEHLTVKRIDDPKAWSNLGKGIVTGFLSSAFVLVNACTIIRRIAAEWFEQLQLGLSAWQSDSISPNKLTIDRINELNDKVFAPANCLLKTTENQSLSLWHIVEKNNDGTYSLDYCKEKIFGWLVNYFCGSKGRVFATILTEEGTKAYIGTIDYLCFWVFNTQQYLQPGDLCPSSTANRVRLQLSHLTTVNFSLWHESVYYALLTQAMDQTNAARDIALFFLNPNVNRQIDRMSSAVVEALFSQLVEKQFGDDGNFEETFCKFVCDHYIALLARGISPEALSLQWLVNTPFLELTLIKLHQKGIDISSVTGCLKSWQISNFSGQSIRTLLMPEDCERLFEQAVSTSQAETMFHLLLTGYCDHLITLSNKEGETPLGIFARLNVLSGLKYVLELTNSGVNHRDNYGRTPLHAAARNGHVECLQELLGTPGIQVNVKDNDGGWLPLSYAAEAGNWECLLELLKALGILVNAKNDDGSTPLSIAAKAGHVKCVRILINAQNIQVNEKNNAGCTPLNSAARESHLECVQELLKAFGE